MCAKTILKNKSPYLLNILEEIEIEGCAACAYKIKI